MYTRANPDWNVDCKCSSRLWMIQMLLRVCSLDPDGDPLCVLLMPGLLCVTSRRVRLPNQPLQGVGGT